MQFVAIETTPKAMSTQWVEESTHHDMFINALKQATGGIHSVSDMSQSAECTIVKIVM